MRLPVLPALLLLAAPLAAQPADTLRAPGLHAPVTLLRDSAGVVHVRAADEHDLFYAQGWNAARDRLFQLELWRRQATGTMAEALGPRWAERDRAARLLRYRGDLARELAHYHPRGAAIVRAFVDGVNAWVDRAARDTALLPPELRALGITPGRWTPEVVVSRHNALVQNAESEVDRARLVARVGAARVRAAGAFEPDPVVLDPDPALDVSALSDSVLAVFRLYRSTVTFERGELRTAALDAADGWDGALEGSNNWAVAGERTASGKPLLANDPHRAITVPSLRYMVHLTAPGWDVIGGGEPAIPGVSLGHNRHGAWGLTVFAMDMADVYAYRLDPADHGRHRWRDGWARIRTVVDTIRVLGEAPRVVRLQYTRHGPVTWVDSARHLAYALRAAWLEPGGAPYLASLRLDQARTWAEFRAGLRYAHVPALNWVWADTGGTIGWQAAGIAPVRRGWSGLLPVPGDGRHEWDGFLPVPELPHHVNPARGWVGSANEMNVPADYGRADAVARTWAEPFRARRLTEVLDSARALTVAHMTALQHDETSLPARALVAALREAAVPAAAATARETLLAWDHVLRADSPAAGLYMAWERALSRAVARRADAGPVALRRVLEWVADPARAPREVFGGAPTRAAARDALLGETLAQAVDTLRARLGADPAGWALGQPRYHHAAIAHPLGGAYDVGPLPRGGSANTLNATGDGDRQTAGASLRVVVDLADWDRSVGTNTPGQSGDPRSPFYRNLFAGWAAGRYFPLPYTTRAVDAAAVRREVLTP